MNKKLIYFSILSLCSSCFILWLIWGLIASLFIGDPLSDSDKNFIGDSSLVIQVLCSLFLPILLALLAKYWKLKFKEVALIYTIIIFLCAVASLVRICLIFDRFAWGVVLINGFISWALPVIIFLISFKLFCKFKINVLK